MADSWPLFGLAIMYDWAEGRLLERIFAKPIAELFGGCVKQFDEG